MKFKSFLSPDAADLPDFSELIGMSQSAGFALSPNVTFAGADATMGTLQQLADFEITGYWASAAGGGGMARKWASNTISVNITGLTPAEQTLATDALADWAAVANLKFTFTDGAANITYNDKLGTDGKTTAFAASVLDASGKIVQSATVQISTGFAPIGTGPDGVGSYLFQTYIHETGHALGLGHTGPYNGIATYGVNNVFTNDTWQWSVMSYFDQTNFGGSTHAFVVTPQMADIVAIQQIYGAPTTSVGNTTYGFNSTAGPIYNFASYLSANLPAPALTIYNTGNNNTLDASLFTQDQIMNLNPGQWSSIGGGKNNIGISTMTNIANAIAGSGNDTIIPNGSLSQKGTLTGGSGNDTFQGKQADLNQYTIANMHAGDKINFTDANLATFTFNLTGSTLNYGNNQITITFLNNLAGKFVASADPVSGVDLTITPSNTLLTGPPVLVSDLTTMQTGVQFFTDIGQATAQAALINATPTTTSVFTYAASLINGQISTAQVAMAGSALMEGGTIKVGDTATPNTLTFLATQYLPKQVDLAVKLGLPSPTVYASEALGLALAGTTGFITNFGGLSTAEFASAVSTATGVSAASVTAFVNTWLSNYTGQYAAAVPPGYTAMQAAFGAAFGDSIGAALLAPTTANLMTNFSTTASSGFSPNTVTGLVANALIDNAEGLYTTGVSLKALPPHLLLQGEFKGGVEQIPIGSSGQSNSGSGTTTVSITQTEAANGNDGIVKIIDANGVSTTMAGTITTIALDGLSNSGNTITDNALTNLTANNSDGNIAGTTLVISDNLTTPTATTLNLNLSGDGVNAAGNAIEAAQLAITDANNDYSTVHLTLNAQNSYLLFNDNGLTTLDTPTAGTGALVGIAGVPSQINDTVAAAVNFDFSGLNGANAILVNRGATVNADVYTLGNFGTDIDTSGKFQMLTISDAATTNVDTINFGSGAYRITDAPHAITHNYVNTAANGGGLANLDTASQWALIINTAPGDTVLFKGDGVQTLINSGAAPSIAIGIANGLATVAHTVFEFETGGNTYYFDHADNSATINTADTLIAVTGIHPINLASLNPVTHAFSIL